MKLSIGVIFGGNSLEHELSILTAVQAMDNIDKDVKIHFVNRTNIDECIIDIWDKIKK